MGDFRQLKIWQKAHELTIKIYELTRKLSEEENYVLKPQLRRAAISCESNIAEGEARFTDAAKLNFFVDTRSSSAEVQTQLQIVGNVYPDVADEANLLIVEYEGLAKQVNSLISYRRINPIAKLPKNLIT